MTRDKQLFKFWIETGQRERLEAIAAQEKVSVAWLLRKAVDEFLAKQKKR